MSRQTFPVFVDQPGCIIRNFTVTGASVGATAGTAGLDGRGQFLCTISSPDATVFTINWNVAFGDTPYIHVQSGPAVTPGTTYYTSTNGVGQTVITASAAIPASGVFYVTVFGYNTTSYVS